MLPVVVPCPRHEEEPDVVMRCFVEAVLSGNDDDDDSVRFGSILTTPELFYILFSFSSL